MQSTQFTWSGFLQNDEKRSELTFKDFTCPPEGGDITGHTNDGRTVKGKIQSNRQANFTLEAANGEKLYFQGSMKKDLAAIIGHYGVEEGEFENPFTVFRKEVQVVQMWSGHYMQGQEKIELSFKDFTCPPEGGDITGLTTDGRIVKGKKQTNRDVEFTLQAANGDTLYFKGQMKKDLTTILGHYGFMKDEIEDNFLIELREAKPDAPVAPVTPVPQETPVTPVAPETVVSLIPKSQHVVKLGQKKHNFTLTENVAKNPKEHDQEHPVQGKLNWSNPLNGLSVYDVWSYQFISLDGNRSAFDSSDCWGKQIDRIIPQGKQIRTVETMLRKNDGRLNGFKWIGDDKAVLLAVGWIDDPYWREDTDTFVVTSLTLKHNQRLVGVRSKSSVLRLAKHYSFQWVICTEE